MKVRAYTIEWVEDIHPVETLPEFTCKHKRVAAFDNYGAAKAHAIALLQARVGKRNPNAFNEIHEVDNAGMVYDRLRVKVGRHWYQVTIKYHPTVSGIGYFKFW